MASRPSRPLPTPPGPVYPLNASDLASIYSPANPYRTPFPHPPNAGPSLPVDEERPAATLRGGTLLHKGFYDLLALIPTPSPSRFLWGASADPPPDVVAGPRYEDLPESNHVPPVKFAPPAVSLPSTSPVSSKNGRRISKDMVSKPMGFVYVCDRCTSHLLASTSTSHLVHASDADQAEAILTRWGPDGLGKLGGEHLPPRNFFPYFHHHYSC